MARKKLSSPPRKEADEAAPQGERLQKVLAAAGVGSRRDCEELITEGRVEVDGQVVTELGVRVNRDTQDIRVDGTRIASPKRLYYAVNKPVGVVSTNYDPSGRTRVIDLVDTDERLYTVGRLDRSSEGLILLTNDGEFANRVAHPRYGIEKTYRVTVAGHPRKDDLDRLTRGVYLAEGVARATSVSVRKKLRESTELEIVLNEGKNREIRRVLARIGHKVLRLKRTAIGRLKLGELPPGAARRLSLQEVRQLLQAPPRRRPARSARSRPEEASGPQRARQKGGDKAIERLPRMGTVLGDEAPAPSAPPPTKKAARRAPKPARANPKRRRTKGPRQ